MVGPRGARMCSVQQHAGRLRPKAHTSRGPCLAPQSLALLLCVSVQRDGKLRADIGSHSRLVSALALHPSRDVVASVAEDGTLAVWSLPLGGNKVGRGGGVEG